MPYIMPGGRLVQYPGVLSQEIPGLRLVEGCTSRYNDSGGYKPSVFSEAFVDAPISHFLTMTSSGLRRALDTRGKSDRIVELYASDRPVLQV
jgi:hypothetical protein